MIMRLWTWLKRKWCIKRHLAKETETSHERIPCARCAELLILVDRAMMGLKVTEDEASHTATINKASIEDDCPICCQLDQLFQPTVAPLDASGVGSCVFELGICQYKKSLPIVFPDSEKKSFLVNMPALEIPECDDDVSYQSSFETSRRVHPAPSIVPHPIDYKTISIWITSCNHAHLGSRAADRWTGVGTLIDCQLKRLCVDLGQPYVCLSYVWGASQANHQSRGDRLPEPLPQTIADAMVVTINIGLRYLWVDRYCIDQSDAEAKHDIIRHMDAICMSESKIGSMFRLLTTLFITSRPERRGHHYGRLW
jgi:hypothetical protein